jgi:hypothetical protein
MDIFIEHLVKKQKTIKDTLLKIAIIGAGFLLAITVLSRLGSVGPILAAVVFYGAYHFITSTNIEYEYSITNGELDIDKIIAQRKRKRILSINCKEFDILAPVNDESYKREFENVNIQKTINAESTIKSNSAYFAVFMHNGVRTRLIFEPTDKMLNAIKKMIPRKVFGV